MESPEEEVRLLIETERRAWDEGDVGLLLSVFHPDAVWVWPQTQGSMDPLDWQMTVGRFDGERWQAGWSRILSGGVIRNQREIRSIDVSPQGDGAVAIVDVDTEWGAPNGGSIRWTGRAVKFYTRTEGVWKMIAHTGL